MMEPGGLPTSAGSTDPCVHPAELQVDLRGDMNGNKFIPPRNMKHVRVRRVAGVGVPERVLGAFTAHRSERLITFFWTLLVHFLRVFCSFLPGPVSVSASVLSVSGRSLQTPMSH